MSNPNLQAGPGWYPDPYREAPLRWWDGARWEAHVSEGAPAAPVVYYAPERKPLAPGTPVYTAWIWLALLLPLVSLVFTLAFYPVDAIAHSMHAVGDASNPTVPNMTSIYTPEYFVNVGIGWVVYGLGVVLCWLDYRALERRGVERPFHWAWSFLLLYVYTIGRSVIVRRVSGGRGSAPIWATIVVIVISVIAMTAFIVTMMAGIFQSVGDLSSVGA